METARAGLATRRRRTWWKPAPGALALAGALVSGACATGGHEAADPLDASGRPDEATLQRIVDSTLPTGRASVRFVDGVAYVTGNVETAIDANAVVRALLRVEGVDRVESRLARGM